MHSAIFALMFFWPAGIANIAPLFAARMPLIKHINTPVDLGKSWQGRRLLGDHKTWRGLLSGVVAAVLTTGLQMLLYANFSWVRSVSGSIDYSRPGVLVLGALLGAGALVGDMIKSFFKRQIGVASGKSWFPFDQIDYIIGGCLASALFVVLPWQDYLIIALVWFILHPTATFVGWLLHLKDSPI